MMTRRALISIFPAVVLGLRASALGADSWLTKNPEEWTEKDTHQILTKSPWAKQVSVEFGDPGDGGFGPRGGGFGTGGPGGGGPPGGGPPGGGGPGGGGDAGPPEFSILVRWASALPVRLASHNSSVAGDHYLIFVSGFPMMGNPGRELPEAQAGDLPERLKSATSLQRKGKDPISAELVQMTGSSDEKGVLFSFPRTPAPIEAADKEVTFVTAMGPIRVRAKFTLREMIYKGRLEL